MKINYNKKRFYSHLIFGSLWLILGVLYINKVDKKYWTDYGYFIIGLSYFGIYFYEKTNQYLTIDNGKLKMNQPYGKKINLNEVNEVEKFEGEYVLKTAYTEFTIYTGFIDPKSLHKLDAVLDKLKC